MSNERWVERKLADLCSSIDYGYTASASSDVVGPKFLRITDIVDGHVNWESVPHCRISEADVERFRLDDQDIVVARTGASTGASAFIKQPPTAVFASYLVRLKVCREADPRFVSYFLKSSKFWDYIHGVLGDKSAQPNASAKTLTQARLALPPLPEQRSIAGILRPLDDKIELNRRMNQTLEEICRTLFKFWFVDFGPVRAKAEGRWKKGKSLPGMPVDMWDLWPSEFEESEIGEIPRGWQVVRLSDRFTTQYGYTAAASQEEIGPHLLRVTDINKSHWIDWSSVPYCSISAEELGRYSLYEGDLVVARMADPGKAAIVEGEPSAVFASYLVRLKNDSLARAYYTFYFLGSDSYLEYAEGARSGSVQANMNARVIVDVPYIDPPRPILDAFLDRVLPFRRRITANLLENSTLAIARDALIPKLLSGEIRVKVDS